MDVTHLGHACLLVETDRVRHQEGPVEKHHGPVRDRHPGHEVGALGEGHLAALGDEQRVVAGLRELRPQRAHLDR